jgi:hypothetical protein
MSWNDEPDYTPQTFGKVALLIALILIVGIPAAWVVLG